LIRPSLPAYHFVPGRSPHPRRDPRGHSYGKPEPRATVVDPEAWADCAIYLRGVELFNAGYWWESHEAFEALWRGAGAGPTASFFQGLIQVAAAELKREMGNERAAGALYGRGLARLGAVGSPFLGVDVRGFVAGGGARVEPARLVLAPDPLATTA
jgi:hypothetical protein